MYLSYIDGLRALAVLSVIVFHINENWLPGGFCGVDVFFVVSGFVVSMSLDKYKDMKIHHFFVLFYARRIKRIIPALIFCLLITSSLAVLFVPQGILSSTNEKTGFFAFFGLSNFILIKNANDYFSPTTDFNFFAHTWSLGVEEQFYVVFPYLFYLWTLTSKKYFRKISIAVFSILLLVSLGFGIYYSNVNKVAEYYSILSRFWELACGILLFQLIKGGWLDRLANKKKLLTAGSFISIILVFAGFILSDEQNFPIPWGFLSVLGTFGTVGFVHYLPDGAMNRLLSGRYITFIGKMSYSLYLWHWPVIVLMRWTIGIETALQYFIAVVMTFILSLISYMFVELPIRYSDFVSKMPRFAVVFCGVLILTGSAYGSRSIFEHYHDLTLSNVRDDAVWFPYTYNIKNGECRLAETYGSIAGGVKIVFECAEAEKKSNGPAVYIIGDSHAGAYNALLKQFTAETGQKSILYSLGGCGDTIRKPLADTKPKCVEYTEKVYNEIVANASKGDFVFLVDLRLNRFCDHYWILKDINEAVDRLNSKIEKDKRAVGVQETINLIKPLSDKGLNVVFELPKPIFPAPVYRCTDWFNKNNPVCRNGFAVDRDYLLKYREPIVSAMQSIADSVNGVYLWDSFDYLCPGKECIPFENGQPLFFDGDHISGHGNAVVAPHFIEWIKKISQQ